MVLQCISVSSTPTAPHRGKDIKKIPPHKGKDIKKAQEEERKATEDKTALAESYLAKKKRQQEEDDRVVFIGQLPKSLQRRKLYDVFEAVVGQGCLEKVFMGQDQNGQFRGFVYLTFRTIEQAKMAVENAPCMCGAGCKRRAGP